MKTPSAATLRKYGMDDLDWIRLAVASNGICPLCERQMDELVIDHEHRKGFKQMSAQRRVMCVRGLLCRRCNWQILRRGMTARIAANLATYLLAYEQRISVS